MDESVVEHMQGNPIPPQDPDKALAEVEHTLEQILALATLSASDLDVDRPALQRTLERLRDRIDAIADTLDQPTP